MNYLDIALTILLLAAFFIGVKRGLILSFMRLLGVVLIFILIRQAGNAITAQLHLTLGIREILATVLTYILILIVVLVFVTIVAYLIKKFLKLVMLGWVDGLLGGILGVLFGFLVITILVLIIELTPLAEALGESRDASFLYNVARGISYSLRINIIEFMPGSRAQTDSLLFILN